MIEELAAWNGGGGIDLESWVGCEGNFSLAVGYVTVFWPKFTKFGNYIFLGEPSKNAIESFERHPGATSKNVEAVLNHLHLVDIQYAYCPDATSDKLIRLGEALKEIYEAKLAWEFPEHPCEVMLYMPDDPDELHEYQITFWQRKHA
jgi:hypothetical protein